MRRRLAALAALPVLALALGAGTAHPAAAESPGKAGWWSSLTAGGQVLPAPTTAQGDLHVASTPAAALAVAAVEYRLTDASPTTLVLKIVPNSAVGTAVVYACPTKDDSWKAGGNQPATDAPAYTCAGRGVQGVVGTSDVTFLLDAAQELSPGVLSLAIVPAQGSTFSLDLAAPGAGTLTTTPAPAEAPPPPPEQPAPAPAAAAPVAPALPTGPLMTGSLGAPAGPSAVLAPPMVASPAAPVLAAPPVGSLPVQAAAASRPVTGDDGRRLATVLLVGLVGLLGYLLGHDQPVPLRLIGGRALRTAEPVPVEGPARGLGRFARPRAEPARRLL